MLARSPQKGIPKDATMPLLPGQQPTAVCLDFTAWLRGGKSCLYCRPSQPPGPTAAATSLRITPNCILSVYLHSHRGARLTLLLGETSLQTSLYSRWEPLQHGTAGKTTENNRLRRTRPQLVALREDAYSEGSGDLDKDEVKELSRAGEPGRLLWDCLLDRTGQPHPENSTAWLPEWYLSKLSTSWHLNVDGGLSRDLSTGWITSLMTVERGWLSFLQGWAS